MHFARCQRDIESNNRILTPLMVMVDYCGFRVLASSLVPLDNQHGHVYGSRDAGRTVYDGTKDDQFLTNIKNIARSLNLANHLVRTGTYQSGKEVSPNKKETNAESNQSNQCYEKGGELTNNKTSSLQISSETNAVVPTGTVELCMPVDAEAHKGKDGRYYMLDLGKVIENSYSFYLIRPLYSFSFSFRLFL